MFNHPLPSFFFCSGQQRPPSSDFCWRSPALLFLLRPATTSFCFHSSLLEVEEQTLAKNGDLFFHLGYDPTLKLVIQPALVFFTQNTSTPLPFVLSTGPLPPPYSASPSTYSKRSPFFHHRPVLSLLHSSLLSTPPLRTLPLHLPCLPATESTPAARFKATRRQTSEPWRLK